MQRHPLGLMSIYHQSVGKLIFAFSLISELCGNTIQIKSIDVVCNNFIQSKLHSTMNKTIRPMGDKLQKSLSPRGDKRETSQSNATFHLALESEFNPIRQGPAVAPLINTDIGLLLV